MLRSNLRQQGCEACTGETSRDRRLQRVRIATLDVLLMDHVRNGRTLFSIRFSLHAHTLKS